MNKTKKILILLLSLLMCLTFAFAMVACDLGGNDGETPPDVVTPPNDDDDPDEPNPGPNPGTHTCDYTIVVDYFDYNSRFPKTLKCSCGETKTRSHIEIYTAEDYNNLTDVFSQENPDTFNCYKFEIKNDIDFNYAEISPMYIYSEMEDKYTFTAPASGITLRNFTIEADGFGNAGLFASVKSDLTIENITIDGATIGSNTTKCAGGFIANINFWDTVKASNADIVINNCSVKNSIIRAKHTDAEGAGGIYGIAYNNLGSGKERNINIDDVEVNGCIIECQTAAGGLLGKASDCIPVKMLGVNVNGYVIKNCQINSSTTNEAGLYAGVLGDGDLKFEYQTNDTFMSTGKIEGNKINDVASANIGRDYGRTGWQAEDNRGNCWFGVSPIYYNEGIH